MAMKSTSALCICVIARLNTVRSQFSLFSFQKEFIDFGNTENYTSTITNWWEIMATIKTAISLEDTLFEQIDELAKELNVSRSRLMALAAEAYLAQYQNQELLAAINDAYEDKDENDNLLLRQMKEKRRAVVDEW